VNIKSLIARLIAEAFACTASLRTRRDGWRVLMFHEIGSPGLNDQAGLFSIKTEFLKGYLETAKDRIASCVLPFSATTLGKDGARISITFDDGYRSSLEVAAPLLVELGLPFTVFVSTAFVRNKDRRFMTPDMLRSLAALPGASIGAHGDSHIALTGCDDKKLHSELLSSRRYLEDIIGAPVQVLTYPYGDVNQRVRDAAQAAGYVMGACSQAGLNYSDRDPLLIKRTEITSHDTVRTFRHKLDGNWDWHSWRTVDPVRS
jgi:peptidoglycan/xylan/chitin deacetylase (PgdA/CDA1 family)